MYTTFLKVVYHSGKVYSLSQKVIHFWKKWSHFSKSVYHFSKVGTTLEKWIHFSKSELLSKSESTFEKSEFIFSSHAEKSTIVADFSLRASKRIPNGHFGQKA